MKNIREIALTQYYPYGKSRERIIAERVFKVDRALEEHDAEIRAEERKKTIDEFADRLPQAFCQYCSQESCEGGMVGSIQECETVRMLKDVIEELVDDMKGEKNEHNN